MDILIDQFGHCIEHFFAGWIFLSVPVAVMIVGVFRRATSPIPSRKPRFGRD